MRNGKSAIKATTKDACLDSDLAVKARTDLLNKIHEMVDEGIGLFYVVNRLGDALVQKAHGG